MSVLKSARSSGVVIAAALVLCVLAAVMPGDAEAAVDVSRPTSTTRIVFVHHSTGDAWLQDGYGHLAATLGANNYFVSDTNYGWGPDGIGNSTDIGHWWTWFRGPSATSYTAALYTNTGINSSYARSLSNPGGDNTVVMFKSCFPNSAVGGSAADAVPAIGSNPLKGNSGPLTVGNAKGVYLDLLEYFKTQPDRLFVLVVSPPLRQADTNATQAANTRYLANWLVDPSGFLNGYTTGNVFVFDYFTVLTGGHHRVVGGVVEHSAGASNYLQFPTGDSHPSAAGDQLATSEFVPMLNAAFNAWKAGTPLSTTRPVYRFFNRRNGSHFYTASESEKNNTIATLGTTYQLDGVAYSVNTLNAANCAPLYRFYNKKNGSHFYTSDASEKEYVRMSLSATYAYDGPAYNVCIAPPAGSQTVYRFFNKLTGSHFYTASDAEKDDVLAKLSATYSLDGPAFYVAP